MKSLISKLAALMSVSLMAACASAPTTTTLNRTMVPPPGVEWVTRDRAETTEEVTAATVNEGWERILDVSYSWQTYGEKVTFSDCKVRLKGLGSKFGTVEMKNCYGSFFYSGVTIDTTNDEGEPITYALQPPSFECIGHQPFVKERRYPGGIVVRTYFPTGGRQYTVHCTAVG